MKIGSVRCLKEFSFVLLAFELAKKNTPLISNSFDVMLRDYKEMNESENSAQKTFRDSPSTTNFISERCNLWKHIKQREN